MDAGKADRWHHLPAEVRERVIGLLTWSVDANTLRPGDPIGDAIRAAIELLRAGDGKEQG